MWIVFVEVLYIKKEITCATFYDESAVKGTSYLEYKYQVNSEMYYHSVAKSELTIKSIDELKQIKCVEIEYSVWFPSFSRVTDKRVIK